MVSERYETGPSPHIVVLECTGSLDIRGGDREEVRIQGDEVPCEVQHTEGRLEVRCAGGCAIRMPQDSSVEAHSVRGALYLRDIGGDVRVGAAHGTCQARRVGALYIERAHGEVTLREIQREASIGAVGGSLYLREMGGPVAIGEVGGELLARDVPYGVTVGHVGGNLAVRSHFEAGVHSSFSVGGSALFRLLPGAGVRFVLPMEVALKLDRGMKSFTEGEHRIVILGDGAATVHIERAASVRIKLRDDYLLDDESAFAFAAAEAVDEQLQRLPGQIRSRVEQHLNAARRRVERARRRAERATRAAHGVGVWLSLSPEGLPHRAEPVSDEERLAILKMLEEGKITVEQAQELLDALEGGG